MADTTGDAKRGKKGRVIGVVVLVIVVLLAVFGVTFGLSASRVMAQMTAANDSFEQFKDDLGAGNVTEACAAVDEMSASAEAASQEIQGWQWQIACALPWIGSDVRDICGLVEVTDSMAGDVLLPIATSYDRLTDGGTLSIEALEGLDPVTLLSKASQLRKLMRAVTGASEVVGECDAVLAGLPDSHFEQLQELVDSMREVIGNLNAALGGVESEEDVIQAMGELISMM